MNVRRIALRGGQVVVSLGLLAYLIATIPMRDVSLALISARPAWLVSGFALAGATTLLGSMQMRAILASQGMAFSLRQVAGINLITMFYGLFLPSYLLSGVIRWHHFSGPEGKRAQALAAMIFSRGVELVTTIGFGIVFWYLAASQVSATSIIASLVLALAAAVAIVLSSVSPAPHAWLRAVLMRLPPARHFRDRVFKVSACLVDFGRRSRTHQLGFLLLSIARNALGIAAFICFAHSLRIAASRSGSWLGSRRAGSRRDPADFVCGTRRSGSLAGCHAEPAGRAVGPGARILIPAARSHAFHRAARRTHRGISDLLRDRTGPGR